MALYTSNAPEIVRALKAGEGRTSIAKRLGIPYGTVYRVSLKTDAPLAKYSTNSWKDKVEGYIVYKDGQCIKWTGPTDSVYLNGTKPNIKPKRAVLLYLGYDNAGHHWGKMTCGNEWCHNPAHSISYGISGAHRDNEIVQLWKLNLEHRTTMQKLGNRFGLSKQRVEQIIRAAGL